MFESKVKENLNLKIISFVALSIALGVLLAGCSAITGKTRSGTVIAKRAYIRSSTAVVAADLLEVVRGDKLDILDSTTAEKENGGERWLRVRAHDASNTEGWIEARNVIQQDLLNRSEEIARNDANIPTQATGQLRASTNLRSAPDRTRNDTILLKLDNGAKFDIVGWKRVPKPKTPDVKETGEAASDDVPKVPDEATELWYRIRLDRAFSPAPAGWVYGKQVELTVPSDIIFHRTGRDFVAWHRLGAGDAAADKDAKEGAPGAWVILEKSNDEDAEDDPNPPDFDRIFVLGYDKQKQEHYTVYRSPDLRGRQPMRVEGTGDNQTIIVNIEENGQTREARYKVYRDSSGNLKVEPPEQPGKGKKK